MKIRITLTRREKQILFCDVSKLSSGEKAYRTELERYLIGTKDREVSGFTPEMEIVFDAKL